MHDAKWQSRHRLCHRTKAATSRKTNHRWEAMTEETAIVQKVWNYAHVLRDAGVSAGEYVEQITCLLFLKMDQERTENLNLPSMIPEAHRWDKLRGLSGEIGRAHV